MTTMGHYYEDESPAVPAAGGADGIGAPTNHAAVVGHHPFQAPSSASTTNPATPTSAGLNAIDHAPPVTRPGK